MKHEFKRLLLLITLVLSPVITWATDVVSENMVFLKEDGKSYLLQRSMRTSRDKYDFHLDKDKGLDSLYYIDPNEYEWDESKPETNVLKFNNGTFTVMYPGDYGDRVTIDDNRVYTLNTWDGVTLEDGHFGSWNKPDNFTRFVQAWVIPETFKIISYESNREGEWIERKNTLTFFSKDVNNVTFTVRYELIDADGDGVADSNDRCKDTPAGVVVDVSGCAVDSDYDGVLDRQDRCADTPEGAVVDEHGCELDGDQDGVVDRLDKCPGTAEDALVDRSGCELDCDGDGVVNSKDNCPRTPAGAAVDSQGCELDTDGDGVTDSNDRCPETPAGAQVNAQGCELDSDGDGVLNAADLCPNTVAGVEVDVTGCEREQPILLRGVNFHYDTANLTQEAMNILDGVARSLLSYPELRLEVAGHTDSSGDDAYNLDLSQRRSEAVRVYLISKGVNADMFSAHGYGEERPVASNATAAGRAENRRVELIRQDQ